MPGSNSETIYGEARDEIAENPVRDSVLARWSAIAERAAAAAARSGRNSADITILAVSKTIPADRMLAAYAAGARSFGESYVQEAARKQDDPRLALPDLGWHFIGHLQRNKAAQVVGRYTLIHSVDRLALAEELGRKAVSAGTTAAALLQVKLDPADTKFGIEPEEAVEAASRFAEIPGLSLQGLMGMAAYSEDPEASRPSFRMLRQIFERLPSQFQKSLSMGMTRDFEVAIEEGATIVRIGTALFGERAPH